MGTRAMAEASIESTVGRAGRANVTPNIGALSLALAAEDILASLRVAVLALVAAERRL